MAGEIKDHNVYILGAGFSRDAGAPLIHDFLDKAREFFDNPDSGLDAQERQHFEEVLKFKREVARAREKFRIDLDNIEELFGLVEMSQRLGSVSRVTRDATVYLIAKTLQLAIGNPSGRPQVPITLVPGYESQASFIRHVSRTAQGPDTFTTDIYTHFALYVSGRYDDQRRVASRSSTVITFNYDLVVDDALARVKVAPAYELGDAIYDDEEDRCPSVQLLKLHGSTNWAICECNQIHVLGRKVTSNPEMFRSMECRKCRRNGLRLLLVPPSWDKSEYSSIMQPVWKKAVDALKTATRICVVGYSMPESDAFFKFLLTLGLAENDHLYKLIVVDLVGAGPAPQEVTIETRWRELLEAVFAGRRFDFQPYGVAHFVQGPMKRLLGRAEQIS